LPSSELAATPTGGKKALPENLLLPGVRGGSEASANRRMS